MLTARRRQKAPCVNNYLVFFSSRGRKHCFHVASGAFSHREMRLICQSVDSQYGFCQRKVKAKLRLHKLSIRNEVIRLRRERRLLEEI